MKEMPGKILPDGRKVFVYNHYPRFFDISFVFIGADRTSFVLEKIASGAGAFVPTEYGNIEKTASTRLNKSLRRGAGIKHRNTNIRIKRKVSRQKKLTPKLMTFSKLESSRKRGLKPMPPLLGGSFLADRSMSPGSSVFVRNNGAMAINNDAQGGVDVFMSRTISRDAIEKVGSAKFAEAEKLSEIFKRVNSLPMGRAVPMRVGREAMIPDDMLDVMSSRGDLPSTLGGLGAAGIALRPREFQRVYLKSKGDHELAHSLRESGRVFRPGIPGNVKTIRISVIGRAPSSLMSLLGPMLAERSSLTPIAVRRSSIISKRPLVKEGMYVDDGILDEVAAAYDSYRTNLALSSEDLMKTALHTPEIMNLVRMERGGDYNQQSGVMEALSVLPVLYFATAYKESVCHCGMTPIEFALNFVQRNPEIAKYLSSMLARR